MSNERHDSKTVIAAQRRVLRMAARIIRKQFKKDTLLTDGTNLWTTGEILEHMRQAVALKVKTK